RRRPDALGSRPDCDVARGEAEPGAGPARIRHRSRPFEVLRQELVRTRSGGESDVWDRALTAADSTSDSQAIAIRAGGKASPATSTRQRKIVPQFSFGPPVDPVTTYRSLRSPPAKQRLVTIGSGT